jgi:hypothetical protein
MNPVVRVTVSFTTILRKRLKPTAIVRRFNVSTGFINLTLTAADLAEPHKKILPGLRAQPGLKNSL